MDKIKNFFKTSLIGGVVAVLPIIILTVVFNMLYNFVASKIRPVSSAISKNLGIQSVFLASVLALLIIIGLCFFIGVLVKTGWGRFLHNIIEDGILAKIPGYTLIRETIKQFTGGEPNPFSSVALVDIYDSGALVTSFVTDRHENGYYTVFVPTGPNPTSGNIFHLPSEKVTEIDISIEYAMKSIISCGAGSKKLLQEKEQIENKGE